MPLPVIADGYYCSVQYVLAGAQFAENTFGISSTSDAATVAGAINDAWLDSVMPELSDEVEFTTTTVQPLDGVSAAFIFSSGGGNGGQAFGMSTDAAAMVVTLRTALAGRRFRGRLFIPGVPGVAIDSTRYLWSATNTTAVQGAIDTVRTDLEANDHILSVLSRAEPALTPVTSVVARQPIGTQRRRLTGGL